MELFESFWLAGIMSVLFLELHAKLLNIVPQTILKIMNFIHSFSEQFFT
jgi:hypothetical protein